MSNIDIYKDNYKNRGADFSYKCRNAITLEVRVQAADWMRTSSGRSCANRDEEEETVHPN